MNFNWKNWSIGSKLRFMSYVLLFNMVTVAFVGYWQGRGLKTYLLKATQEEVPAVRHFTLVDMYHDGIMGMCNRMLAALYANDHRQIADAKTEILEMVGEFKNTFDKVDALDFDPEISILVDQARPGVNAYAAAALEIANIGGTENLDAVKVKMPDVQKKFADLEVSLGAIGERVEDGAKILETEANGFVDRWSWINILNLVQGFLVGIFLPILIIRSLLNTMQSTIKDLTTESSQVRGSATEIASSSDALSSSSTEQAAALQETASSIEEMNAMLKKSADNAARSKEISQQSRTTATRGKEAVDRMMRAIEEINHSNDSIMKQTEESNRKISDIVKVINEIGNKTKVINDIVFQTKLLSFNASVEAARAGEHGKGFAVVAEEVGNLAQMSGNAAKEISDMLQESIQQVESIIVETKTSVERLVEDGKSKVDSGSRVARECGEVLDDVVRNVITVNDMINEIASATQEQSQGVGEITKAMNQLDSVTHQNSAAAGQAAKAGESLTRQSDNLLRVVRNLRHFVEGANGAENFTQPRDLNSFKAMTPSPFSRTLDEKTEILENLTPPPIVTAAPKLAKVTKSPVPGKKLMSSSEMNSVRRTGTGTLDEIPSENDSRFQDF